MCILDAKSWMLENSRTIPLATYYEEIYNISIQDFPSSKCSLILDFGLTRKVLSKKVCLGSELSLEDIDSHMDCFSLPTNFMIVHFNFEEVSAIFIL